MHYAAPPKPLSKTAPMPPAGKGDRQRPEAPPAAHDTCDFPLFSHDLMQNATTEDGSLFFEALVLQELEDMLTKRTRVCFRDAFFRLAQSSRAKCSNATHASQTGAQQAADQGNASSWISTPGCPERETNAFDGTVADLTMKPPRPFPLKVLVS